MPTTDAVWLVNQITFWVSEAIVLVPLVIAFRRWPAISPIYRPIVWFCLARAVMFILDLFGLYVLRYNIAFLHLKTALETWLLGWAYCNVFSSRRMRQGIRWSLLIFTILAIVDSFFLSGLWKRNNYTIALQSTLIIGFALLYFEQLLHELRNVRLEQDSIFLVSIGSALYYAGTVVLFMLENTIPGHSKEVWTMFNIASALVIVQYVFIAKALQYAGAISPRPIRMR